MLRGVTYNLEKSTYVGFGIFVAIVAVGLFFVLPGNSGGITGNAIAVGGPGETVDVNTVIQGFQYRPDTITVKEGSKVRLTIENKDNVLHGLHLPQFGLNGGTPGGATKTFEFVARETPTNGQALPTCTQEHGEKLTIKVI